VPTEPVATIDLFIPEDGLTLDGLQVSELGQGRFRVDEIPVICRRFAYKDVIAVAERRDGIRELTAVAVHAGWRRFDYLLSRDIAECPGLQRLLEKVRSLGGAWCRYFGGGLAIALPPGSEWDPMVDLTMLTGGTTTRCP